MDTTSVLQMLVSDVLSSAPAAARVFLNRGMSCPGCPFSAFETVSEVAANYRCDAEALAADLLRTQSADAEPGRDRT